MLLNHLQKAIFSVNKYNFEALTLEIFKYQSENCLIYRQYLQFLQTDLTKIIKLKDIPYLPIEFFKYFPVTTNTYEPEIIFESSSTTGKGVSKHHVRSFLKYEKAFIGSFEYFYGNMSEYCHLALLPSYLERDNSSLVYQINHFVEKSKFSQSGFFLHNFDELANQIVFNETREIPTILWGVTFALLDFIERYQIPLKHTFIIETGGMKGRRKEIVRDELHQLLKTAFDIKNISGEYGMTELLSQAYAHKNGIYKCPPWMKVIGREINDPLTLSNSDKNVVLNVIDLANIDSCCFIATSDLGKIYKNGAFEVLGRLDNSDIRGCNLMI